MNRLLCLTAALLFVPSFAYCEEKNTQESVDRTRPAEKILGLWEITKGVNQGEEMSKEELSGTTVLVKRYMMITYDRDQNERYRATFKINADESPMHIDMTSMIKGQPPAKALGIIKIEKDRWVICYGLPGQPRPEEFASSKKDQTMLFVQEPAEKATKAGRNDAQ